MTALPEKIGHRIFKIFKANAYEFDQTVDLIKTEYFKDLPTDDVRKIVANQLRNHPYNILINDDGTFIEEPPNNNQDSDLMTTLRTIKQGKKMPKKEITEEDTVKFVSKLKEVIAFEKNHPDNSWDIGEMNPKEAKKYGKKNDLWIVELDDPGVEKLRVIVDMSDESVIKIESTDSVDEDDEGTDLGKLKGLTNKIRDCLEELGILSIEDLANAQIEEDDLEEVSLDNDVFDEWITRANDYLKKPTTKSQTKKTTIKKEPKPEPPEPKPDETPQPKPPKPTKKQKQKKPIEDPPDEDIPTPKPDQPVNIRDILDEEEQKVYENILDFNIGSDGRELRPSFGQELVDLVTSTGKPFSIMDDDVPETHHTPPPSLLAPVPPIPDSIPPLPKPSPVPPLQSTVPKPVPPPQQTVTKPPPPPPQPSPSQPPTTLDDVKDIRSRMFEVLSEHITSSRYPSMIDALKKRFRKIPPIY